MNNDVMQKYSTGCCRPYLLPHHSIRLTAVVHWQAAGENNLLAGRYSFSLPSGSLGVAFYSPANSLILQTVLQLRSVIGTPMSFSELAASFDLPTPSGACR